MRSAQNQQKNENSEKMANKYTTNSNCELSRRYLDLYRSRRFVDCSFNVDGTILKSHKLILAAASPVFEAMFYGPLADSRIVEISDISADVFQIMLEYIYTGDVNIEKISIEEIIELYYSAEKYILSGLLEISLKHIQTKFRFENILPAMDLSVYMQLQPLLKISMDFFSKCCLSSEQFCNLLETNYYHVTKDCLKIIVELGSHAIVKNRNWFVRKWCQYECKSLGLSEDDFELVLNDLELPNNKPWNNSLSKVIKDSNNISKSFYSASYAERTYFKATRPFIISDSNREFNFILKTDRFVSLHGLVINSRLIPSTIVDMTHDQEYLERLLLEMVCDYQVIHRQKLIDHKTNYNCYLSIPLQTNVILIPDKFYHVKLVWDQDAFGAEYPSSICSNEVRGITFIENFTHIDCGSILKGIKYIDLVQV